MDTPDSLRHALDVVARRIDRALDRNDRRLFMLSCQHRAQLLHRLATAEDETDGERACPTTTPSS